MPKCDIKIRYIPATFAWILLLVTTFLFFFYPCQYYMKSHPWVPAYQGVITFFVLANFTMATFMDPGIIPKASPDEDREEELRAPLYKNAEINGITVKMKWCVTCKFYRPPRCSHCSVCNHCIETFDHHCPWVNNCIGRRNYRFFFFFLVSLSIHMLSIFSLCLFYILKIMPNIKHVAPIIAIVLMGLVTILAIPIFGLTGFHMVLVSRGRTTNEQVTGKFKGGYNPFSRGCWHNCCYTQFGPQYPSLLKPETYTARRSHKENQPISTIITECDNNEHTIGGPNVFHSKNDMNAVNIQQSAQEMVHNYYDRENRHTQVKTYTDQGSGCNQRSGSTTLYSKLSPGRECSDTDMEPQASQSQDCEPTPPLQRHNSAGFFLPALENINCNLNGTISSGVISGSVNMNNSMDQSGGDSPRHTRIYHLRHSPHIRQRGAETHCNYGDTFSPDHQNNVNSQEKLQQVSNRNAITSTPTMQQRNKPLLVATPLIVTNVKRSNPSTPTQVRRSEFTNINPQQFPKQSNSTQAYYEINTNVGGNNGLPPQHPQIPTIQQHQRNTMLQHQQQTTGGSHTPVLSQSTHKSSPQRRFLSEGELVRQTNSAVNRELTYTCSNNTVDNIRELAGSPQQSMYMWKDASPCISNSSGNANMISFHNVANNTIGGISSNSKQHGANGVQYMVAGTQREHALNTAVHPCLHQDPSYNTQSYTQSQPNATCNALQRSNPTSPTNNLPNSGTSQTSYMVCYGNSPPTSQCQSTNYGQTAISANQSGNSACYQPKLHGGIPVFPSNPGGINAVMQSPQIKRKQTPTRPMSFVRALEMTDSMEMYTLDRQQQQQQQQQQQHQHQHQHQLIQEKNRNNVVSSNSSGNQQYLSKNAGGAHSNSSTVPVTPERGSVYDVNYEISV